MLASSPNAKTQFVQYLKRSQFLIGLARARRGLATDIRVIIWLLKRKEQKADYLNTHATKKLQLGTSNNILVGWLNTDIYPNHGPVAYLDVTRRFPFPDNTFDYIMAEHMIEHIDYGGAEVMLRECFRTLKPGGRVRFATPDLTVVLELHSRQKTDPQRNYIDWQVGRSMPQVKECKDAFVINHMFRAWGHCFLYDAGTLYHVLDSLGFREIKFYKPGVSEDPNLMNLESHGREIGSEDMNQFETIVIEGRKELAYQSA